MSERPLTYDHLRSQKKPVTKSVTFALDSEVADVYDEARGSWEAAKSMLSLRPDDEEREKQVKRTEEAYLQAKAALEEASFTFTFKSLGRRKFEEIIEEHPPTPDQVQKAKDLKAGDVNWNTDTLPVALISACCVSPALTEEDVKEIWDSPEWSGSETMELFLTALNVNQSHRRVDLGKD